MQSPETLRPRHEPAAAKDRFLALLRASVETRSLSKLTLGKYRGPDPTLRNLFIRPVELKSGPQLSFLWRHATRDVTKNHPAAEALAQAETLIGRDFLDAHLFTATETAQLEMQPDGTGRLRVKQGQERERAPATTHDRAKTHLIDAAAPWLRALGVMNDRGQPREGMADKFRQIQKFAELLTHLLEEAFPGSTGRPAARLSPGPARGETDGTDTASSASESSPPIHVVDMGSGKGYLTFAIAALLRDRAVVRGIEARPELVQLCNRIAREQGLAETLSFAAGSIADTPVAPLDVLIALHACDTATDDALAKGIAAEARLLVVAPCCQKELRRQLTAPPVLADALEHGIFQERQAEFVTDALRAQLLEWAGYRTKVFEFISTEHTAKNLMIAGVKSHASGDPDRARRIREFAAFYGIRTQRLATQLGFAFAG